MKKIDATAIEADWTKISPRSPFGLVSSIELARVLGVHLQTICNWRIRGILPPAVPKASAPKGNRYYYRISAIQAWLADKQEEEIAQTWVDKHIGGGCTVIQAQNLASVLKGKFDNIFSEQL
jgi:hypothetical protein